MYGNPASRAAGCVLHMGYFIYIVDARAFYLAMQNTNPPPCLLVGAHLRPIDMRAKRQQSSRAIIRLQGGDIAAPAAPMVR